MDPHQSRNAPCPCGSGKKYKRCHGANVVTGRHRPKWLIGASIALAAAALIGLAITQRANAPRPTSAFSPTFYGGRGGSGVTSYSTIEGIDFSGLSEAEHLQVMKTANKELCTCGCRLTLAECINTDMTCPIRRQTIARARQLVAQARKSSD